MENNMKIRWIKVFGIFGTSFFTSLAALLTIDALTSNVIPLNVIVPASIIVALIQGGLAFCREITRECEEDVKYHKKAVIKKAQMRLAECNSFKSVAHRILNNVLI